MQILFFGLLFSVNCMFPYKGKLINNTPLVVVVTIGNAVWEFIKTTVKNKQTFRLEPGQSVDYNTNSMWFVALDSVAWQTTDYDTAKGTGTSGALNVGQQWRPGGTWTFSIDPSSRAVVEKHSS